jgi:hypothetical protein
MLMSPPSKDGRFFYSCKLDSGLSHSPKRDSVPHGIFAIPINPFLQNGLFPEGAKTSIVATVRQPVSACVSYVHEVMSNRKNNNSRQSFKLI